MAKRFNFEIRADGDRAIQRIREQTRSFTKADVVRDALALYELLVEEAVKGNALKVGDKPVVFPPLQRALKGDAK